MKKKNQVFYTTFQCNGTMHYAFVTGRNADAVNAYIIKHFDVMPDAPFTVTSVPAETIPAGVRKNMPVMKLHVNHAPTKKYILGMFTSIGFHISMENSKLGKIPNMSLAPGKSCSADACRTCLLDGCYACDSYRQYPETRTAWNENTDIALYNVPAMEYVFNVYFRSQWAPDYFRLHVGGDFISKEYANAWRRIAENAPNVRFLAFTKQFDIIDNIEFPANFRLRLSDWPGIHIPDRLKKKYHVAWLDDGTRPLETFPADALECPGNCETCGACWDLDRDTIFRKHGSKAKKKRIGKKEAKTK